jgi:hypothetical protein
MIPQTDLYRIISPKKRTLLEYRNNSSFSFNSGCLHLARTRIKQDIRKKNRNPRRQLRQTEKLSKNKKKHAHARIRIIKYHKKKHTDMAITILIDYTLCISLGIGIGVIASWIYSKRKNKTKVIGHIIETAMMERNVLELEILSKHLNQIVSRIQECNDDLIEKILNMQDIEFSLSSYPELRKSIEELGTQLDLDVLEKNK